MQNLHTLQSLRFPLKLPTSPHLPLFTSLPTPTLHLIHRSTDNPSTLLLSSFPLPPSNAPVTQTPIPHSCGPASALVSSPDGGGALLLSLRSGEIHMVHPESQTASILADVSSENPQESGVLALVPSPDAHLLAIVSPTTLTLVDSSFAPLHEWKFPCLVSHATVAWRSDGEFLTVVVREAKVEQNNEQMMTMMVDDNVNNNINTNDSIDNTTGATITPSHASSLPSMMNNVSYQRPRVRGFVIDRLCTDVKTLDIDATLCHDLSVCVAWEPRPGGAIVVSGPGSALTFFERNGERLRRKDVSIESNGTPKTLCWSNDCTYLAMSCEETDDQGEGDAYRVAFYTHANYKWYCKKRLIFQHRVLDIVWDEDDTTCVTIVSERDVIRLKLESIPSIVTNSGIAAVVHANTMFLTHLIKAVVPPPLAHARITLDEDITAMAASKKDDGFVAITADGALQWVFLESSSTSPTSTEQIHGIYQRVVPIPPEVTRCVRGRCSLMSIGMTEQKRKTKRTRRMLRNDDNDDDNKNKNDNDDSGSDDEDYNRSDDDNDDDDEDDDEDDDDDLDYDNDDVVDMDNTLGAHSFRMPIITSKSCAVVAAPDSPWRDRCATPPGDALYMIPLASTTSTTSTSMSNNSTAPSAPNTTSTESASAAQHVFTVPESTSTPTPTSVPPTSFSYPSTAAMTTATTATTITTNSTTTNTTTNNNNSNSNNNNNNPHYYTRMLIDGARVTAIGHSAEDMSIVVTTSNGILLRAVVDEYARRFVEIARMSHISTTVTRVTEVPISRGRALVILHDENDGRLDVAELATSKRIAVSSECTSFCVHEGFLIFTTRAHVLFCLLLDTKSTLSSPQNRNVVPSVVDVLDQVNTTTTASMNIDNSESTIQLFMSPSLSKQGGNKNNNNSNNGGVTRPIDRGSLIVAPLQGKTDIVLQAPRGNLETIAPRPIVFETVDRLAKTGDYGRAFELCRRQRVDMNHIVDADVNTFLSSISSFVQRVTDPSHLSVFLTHLTGNNEKINAVCRAVVETLESIDKVKYSSSILTGLVRQQPSDLRSAMKHVASLKKRSENDEEQKHARNAVDLLFVLVKDEMKIYGEALGYYDLKLAAFVAECSQMDPADYSKELEEFRQITNESLRKYHIDSRLKRYDSALTHLFACGEEHYQKCVQLSHQHALYETAIPLFATNTTTTTTTTTSGNNLDKHTGAMLTDLKRGYAKHLRDAGNKPIAAAETFAHIGDWYNAAECYRIASMWQMALYAFGQHTTKLTNSGNVDDQKQTFYSGLANDLVDNGQPVAAARIRVSMLRDLGSALDALAAAGEWDACFEAVEMYSINTRDDDDDNEEDVRKLVTDRILEGYNSIVAMLRENRNKLSERGKRLVTLQQISDKLGMSNTAGKNNNDHDDHENESDVFSATSASSLGSNLSDVTFTSRGTSSATSLYSTITNSGGGAAGPLSNAKLEKQAMKRQQRASKKRIREGHPNEREYLVSYLRKLIPTTFVRTRVERIVKALLAVGKVQHAQTVMDEMNAVVETALTLPNGVLTNEVKEELETRKEWNEMSKNVTLLCCGGSYATGSGLEVGSGSDARDRAKISENVENDEGEPMIDMS